MKTLPPTYCGGLIGHASVFFINLVQTTERVEGGFKIEKSRIQILFEQTSSGTNGSRRNPSRIRKMKEERRRFTIFQAKFPHANFLLSKLPLSISYPHRLLCLLFTLPVLHILPHSLQSSTSSHRIIKPTGQLVLVIWPYNKAPS